MDDLTGKVLGGCTLQRLLGQGGMGTVYLAHHPGLNRSVAVKILSEALADNPDYIERFQREARLAARLEHPNVVTVHDVGVTGGLHYITMQFVDGKSLDQVLKERRKLSVNEALSIGKRVAAALGAAAKLGIVHRDIKPHNLLVSKDGMLKVADFGLAKDNDANRTLSDPGRIVGTPHYMSPEQAQGKPVDIRGDIYSLGATLYHMLSGHRAFEGATPIAIVMKQINEEPRPLAELEPSIPAPVRDLVARMMRKNPAERFASYEELTLAIDAAKTGVTAPAGPASLPAGRKSLKVAGAVAGVLFLGIVLGVAMAKPKNPPVSKSEAKATSKPAPTPGPKPVPKPEPSLVPKPEPAPGPKPEPAPEPVPAPKPAPKVESPKTDPREMLLSRFQDRADRRWGEEVLDRTEQFLKAAQQKDVKALKGMMDTLTFGDPTEEALKEFVSKILGEKVSLAGWEIQSLEVKSRGFARPQPHAQVNVTYKVAVPNGELAIPNQVVSWVRRIDGAWYLTRAPRSPGK